MLKVKMKVSIGGDISNCGEVVSLTFGDQGENHVGMEKVGSMVDIGQGFNLEDFMKYQAIFEEKGYIVEIHKLNDLYTAVGGGEIDAAFVMVVRKGMSFFLEDYGKTDRNVFDEMNKFSWDKKYYDTRRKKSFK